MRDKRGFPPRRGAVADHLVAAFSVLALGLACGGCGGASPHPVVFYNAVTTTAKGPSSPTESEGDAVDRQSASWFAVVDGKIVAQGTDDDELNVWRHRAGREVDLQQRITRPGLVARYVDLNSIDLNSVDLNSVDLNSVGQSRGERSGSPTVDTTSPPNSAELPDEAARGAYVVRILAAQRWLLARGVTTVFDDTRSPERAAKLAELARAGLVQLRIRMLSDGADPRAHALMRTLSGRSALAAGDVRYDGALHDVEPARGAAKADISCASIEDIFLFAGPYGLAFRVRTDAAAKRVLAARLAVGHRRADDAAEMVLGCAACDPDTVEQLLEAGIDVVDDHPITVTEADEGAHLADGSEAKSVGLERAALPGLDDTSGALSIGDSADFITLDPSSEPDRHDSSRLEVAQTWVGGQLVYDQSSSIEHERLDEATIRALSGASYGDTLSPVIGYSPTAGFILGGAWFVRPYARRGFAGEVQAQLATSQLRVEAVANAEYALLLPWLSLGLETAYTGVRSRYFGVGMNTPSEHLFETDPHRLEVRAGPEFHLPSDLEVQLRGQYRLAVEGASEAIRAVGGDVEGHVEGSYGGADLSIAHDTRDVTFSTRRGGTREIWVTGWLAQGDAMAPRIQTGVRLTQFIALYAPDVVLALLAEGAASFGDAGYATNYRLGGIDRMRGYLENRFRGHHMARGAAELRFPIWSFVSGVAFGEAGRVWVPDDAIADRNIGLSGGGGLRFGLPPDEIVKLRFDVGFAADQWGIFFAFNEVF